MLLQIREQSGSLVWEKAFPADAKGFVTYQHTPSAPTSATKGSGLQNPPRAALGALCSDQSRALRALHHAFFSAQQKRPSGSWQVSSLVLIWVQFQAWPFLITNNIPLFNSTMGKLVLKQCRNRRGYSPWQAQPWASPLLTSQSLCEK